MGLFFLGAVLLGGVGGVFGTTRTESESGHGVRLEVSSPRTTRSGLPLDLDVEVSSDSGLPRRLTLTLSSSYVDLIDELSVVPAPRSQRTAPGRLVVEVETEPGRRSAEIRVKGRVSPSARGMHRGLLQVDGGPAVRLSTFVWP